MKRFASALAELFRAAPRLTFSVDPLLSRWRQTICLSWVGHYNDEGFHGPRCGISLGVGQRAFTLIWV